MLWCVRCDGGSAEGLTGVVAVGGQVDRGSGCEGCEASEDEVEIHG